MSRRKEQVVRIHETGGPGVLQLDEVELPPPSAGEARVRHHAVGINFIDTYHRKGLYPVPSLPSGLGMEAAGVVEELGEGVDGVAVGDRVGYLHSLGCYATARNVPATELVPLPDGVDDDTAAASLLKGMTVEMLIHRVVAVQPHMTVLLHAAAGGVGLLASQWLSHLGCTVIGTAGSDEKADLARAHGCTHVIVYTRDDFVARTRELTDDRGVDVVYDSVGQATFDGSLACLAKRGTLVAFGNASGKPGPFDPMRLAKGSLFLTRPRLFDYNDSREALLASAQALFDIVREGIVRVEVRQRWPLSEAADAHRALEARETIGASVLKPV